MRMNKEFRPELVYATDKRLSLSCPFLDIETDKEGVRVGRIVATDGHRLIVVPVELDDTDTMGSIPISAFILARKGTLKHFGEIIIYCTEGVCTMTDGGTVPRPDNGRFPDYRPIVANRWPGEVLHEISFDPKLLASMVKAMGATDRITLRLSGNKPIHLVSGSNGTPAEVAMLMPMS